MRDEATRWRSGDAWGGVGALAAGWSYQAPRRSLQHSQVAPASRSQLRAIEYENSGSSIEDEEKCGSWEKSVFLRGGPGVTAVSEAR